MKNKTEKIIEKINKLFFENGYGITNDILFKEYLIDEMELLKGNKESISEQYLLNVFFKNINGFVILDSCFTSNDDRKVNMGYQDFFQQLIKLVECRIFYDEKEKVEIKTYIDKDEFNFMRYEDVKIVLENKNVLDFLATEIKEIKLHIIFISGDILVKKVFDSIEKWVKVQIEKSGFIQKIEKELPGLILELCT